MNKIICSDYNEVCAAAADIFAQQLSLKPSSVFGLATGSTPVGLYEELKRRCSARELDFSKAHAFNLDEYYPIEKNHPQSYKAFMDLHLFDEVKFESTQIPNGEAADPHIECARYDAAIEAAGGIDLQLLGIGINGHIGFNEPNTVYPVGSHLTELTESTLIANSRFFGEGEKQPETALTMGLGPIFNAKHILLLITGAAKAQVAKKLFDGKLYTDVPACFLLLHPNVTVILDKAASG
ncbi:MAG: glucosamine-6-phosphate deaminase [Oscillospiraceae bacterium]|nr:glucosamine-6-phosphate deaminase [Oscillospiraceae bacterium]